MDGKLYVLSLTFFNLYNCFDVLDIFPEYCTRVAGDPVYYHKLKVLLYKHSSMNECAIFNKLIKECIVTKQVEIF